MSKRSRRRSRVASGPALRRTPPPAPRRGTPRWLVLAGAAAVLIVTAIAVFVVNQPNPLRGIQTGLPPWLPETSHLRARLDADGLPVLTAAGQAQHTHQHLDLFVDGQQVVIPTDIGIDRATGVLSPIHTHDATGIIHVESPVVRDYTLGDFFDVWGVRFDGHCVGATCDGTGRTVSVDVNGRAFTGDPRSLVLEAHEEIVVAVGTLAQLPSPIPSSYAFPAGL
jgi:hypothetical protein